MNIELINKSNKDIVPVGGEFKISEVAIGKQLFLSRIGTENVYTTTKVLDFTQTEKTLTVITESNTYMFQIF